MNNITNANYRQAKSFWEDSETKSCSKYHTLYVRSDIVLLVEIVFEICVLKYMNLTLLYFLLQQN